MKMNSTKFLNLSLKNLQHQAAHPCSPDLSDSSVAEPTVLHSLKYLLIDERAPPALDP